VTLSVNFRYGRLFKSSFYSIKISQGSIVNANASLVIIDF